MLRIPVWIKAFLFSSSLFAALSEEESVRRIRSHLTISDFESAIREGKIFIEAYPDSHKLRTAYLEALCAKGEEMEAFEQFRFFSSFLEKENDRFAAETLAWGVLGKGRDSALTSVRLYALLGAAFTNDAKALPIVIRELKGDNAFFRALATKIAASYGDDPLRNELLRMLREERVWFTRIEVIHALGALRVTEAKPFLRSLVERSMVSAEEKAAAILALTAMYDRIEREELQGLLSSPRAGLRSLGCELIAKFRYKEGCEDLLPLLSDASPVVRVRAMTTLGLLGIRKLQGESVSERIQKNLSSEVPLVAITAAWLATVSGSKQGLLSLRNWMLRPNPEHKRLAAAALAKTGAAGVVLASEQLDEQKDPYVRMNLAFGLIEQRKETAKAAEALFEVLSDSKRTLWMREEEEGTVFTSMAPSRVEYNERIPGYPEAVDGLTRLQILSYLHIAGHPGAIIAIKEFLQKRAVEVTSAAAVFLLEEEGDEALPLIRSLLEDGGEEIRVRAALILAILGDDPDAIDILMNSYALSGREEKIRILEALGHIKDPKVRKFLLQALQEPFQSIRIVAASSLIQNLYR